MQIFVAWHWLGANHKKSVYVQHKFDFLLLNCFQSVVGYTGRRGVHSGLAVYWMGQASLPWTAIRLFRELLFLKCELCVGSYAWYSWENKERYNLSMVVTHSREKPSMHSQAEGDMTKLSAPLKPAHGWGWTCAGRGAVHTDWFRGCHWV